MFIVRLAMLLAAAVQFHSLPASAESGSAAFWYRLEVQTGDSTYQCIGSSPLDEKAFAKAAAGQDFLELSEVSYLDKDGRTKSWQEWDSRAQPRLYVNPRYLIFFNPLKGDPIKGTEKRGRAPAK
jgi:hypothetical protein